MKRVDEHEVGPDFRDIRRLERRFRPQSERAYHGHGPPGDRIVFLFAMELKQVQPKRAQTFVNVGPFSIHEYTNQARPPPQCTNDLNGRIKCDTSRTWRIKIKADEIHAEFRRSLRVTGRDYAADLYFRRHDAVTVSAKHAHSD